MTLSRPRRAAHVARDASTRTLVVASLVSVLTTGLALVVGLTLLVAPTASATLPTGSPAKAPAAAPSNPKAKSKAVKIKVSPRLFGLHDAHLTSLSRRSTRSIRLWDAGTTWPELEPTRDNYDWSRLDQIVKAAHRNHTEVTLVLADTPAWAAADPDHAAPTDPPAMDAWRDYVRAVMTRYAPKNWHYRGIANFQVWNEADITTFWTGNQVQMAALIRAAARVRASVDPGARLIAPSMVIRLPYQQKWLAKFYGTKVGGKPVWKYVDAAAVSGYPVDTAPVNPLKPTGATRPATPEDSMRLLQQVRTLLAKDRVSRSLPMWNTEINYGMHTGSLGGHSAAPISSARQVAYVMRTYLLNAAAGVQRVDWYAYDMGNLPEDMGGGPLGNTLLTVPADQAAGRRTPAGVAFTRIQGWMKGTLIGTHGRPPCSTDKHGTYTCVVRYAAHRVGRIYWNPYSSGKVRLVRSAHRAVDEFGRSRRVAGGATLKVTYQPILVKSQK